METDATCGMEMDANCGMEPYVIDEASSGLDSVVRIIQPPTRARPAAPARTAVRTYPQDILRIFKNRSETAHGRHSSSAF
jgi:hypothetical protein